MHHRGLGAPFDSESDDTTAQNAFEHREATLRIETVKSNLLKMEGEGPIIPSLTVSY